MAQAITASLSSLSLPSTVVATNQPGWAGMIVMGMVTLIFMATPSVARQSTVRRSAVHGAALATVNANGMLTSITFGDTSTSSTAREGPGTGTPTSRVGRLK